MSNPIEAIEGSIERQAKVLVDLARVRGCTIATCESLSAGLLAASLAQVPGASAVLRGGLITYATDLKVSLAGVDAALINDHTVVSGQVAEAMAQGARKRCSADYAIALTGVAGPGTQDGHPVGTVWCGIAGPESSRFQKLGGESGLKGSRNEIRASSVDAAIDWAIDVIGEQILEHPR
ncbi:CinA family protein [Corynebacterium pelargi]|uniref:Competence-damage inducible protein n=1 Tax=Corynebacterium pelargi TaxID=1471400 RepID=A0A410W8B4_9CORY|nr:CinA family protein [Corynebacterium pelargi]QAU52197.1 Putative competence-damage inducible protein [Corynebacterium pelargi]GGG69441.1 competence protein [Corynebacterium pelargi]